MATAQQSYAAARESASRSIAPLFFLIGIFSVLSGILTLVLVGTIPGAALFVCGLAAIAAARIMELLTAIETDLSAMRSQMGMGVFGLLGAPPKR